MPTEDLRLHSAAAERNAAPILAALQRILPAQGTLLEIASGTGQHAAQISAGLPGWHWQPTDVDAAALASIGAWCAGLAQVRPPRRLDVLRQPWVHPWLAPEYDAMFCANLLHIAPWDCTAGLMKAAARHLATGGVLVTYGPVLEDGVVTSPGNLAFDAELRERDPGWGLRRLADVTARAHAAGLRLRQRVEMPANNLLLVWARGAADTLR
jgi:hypothetical protein